MPIPPFDGQGLLPEGVHLCSMEEIHERLGSFQRTDCRVRLFQKLKEYVAELRKSGLARAVIVDGSFATSIDEPNDIDLIVIFAADHHLAASLRPSDYNLVSKRRVRKQYGFDLLAARDQSTELKEYIAFFQQVRDSERRKGLLKVEVRL